MLTDSFKRKIEYLRLSVTDLCNLRCHYCLPPEGVKHRERAEILTFEEIERMVRIFSCLGVRRVRTTGGEPLVRKNLPDLIRRLNRITGLEEVLLTTNGILLERYAQPLREAGLKKINIHLDTLSPEKFRQITRWGDVHEVLKGIREARRVGFSPIKLNVVVQKGFNDEEVGELLLFAAKHQLILRYIEMMPIGPARQMSNLFVPMNEVRQKLEEKFTLIPAIAPRVGSGPAVYYQVKEIGTMIGFISPITRPFCDKCDRIRVSSDGRFQDCLAYGGAFSLRDLLRNQNLTDADIAGEIVGLMRGKRGGHDGFVQAEEDRTPFMCGIGG